MKNQDLKISKFAKIIAASVFLGVFILNVASYIDVNGESMSLSSLRAYAQTGGSNNEEEGTKYDHAVTVTTTIANLPCTFYNPTTKKWQSGTKSNTTYDTTCEGTGDTDCERKIESTETDCI